VQEVGDIQGLKGHSSNALVLESQALACGDEVKGGSSLQNASKAIRPFEPREQQAFEDLQGKRSPGEALSREAYTAACVFVQGRSTRRRYRQSPLPKGVRKEIMWYEQVNSHAKDTLGGYTLSSDTGLKFVSAQADPPSPRV
jgi:hypothetical protein